MLHVLWVFIGPGDGGGNPLGVFEATGAAAVLLGAALRRDLTIRQGVGSEIHIRARDDGCIDVGGRVELIEHRSHGERR